MPQLVMLTTAAAAAAADKQPVHLEKVYTNMLNWKWVRQTQNHKM